MATLASSAHTRVRKAWLAQVSEAILNPGLPVVDAHHHLWDRPGARYLFTEILADTRSDRDIRTAVFGNASCGGCRRRPSRPGRPRRRWATRRRRRGA
jgi:hypothetical protein